MTRLPERLLLACALTACASDHRVSPWGDRGAVPLGVYVERPDLDRRLAEIEAETASLHLVMVGEHRGKLPGGGIVVLRVYGGTDALGRPMRAVRAATDRGVVMAVGPPDPLRAAGTKGPAALLLPNVPPAADLNGDGAPDVVLRGDDGVLEIWRLEARGSTRVDVALATPALRFEDVDADGRLDFAGERAPIEGSIAPMLSDVATFDGVRYTHRTESARAWHAGKASDPDRPSGVRGAIERAWHRLLAGEPRKAVLDDLAKEPVPLELRAEAARYRTLLDGLVP